VRLGDCLRRTGDVRGSRRRLLRVAGAGGARPGPSAAPGRGAAPLGQRDPLPAPPAATATEEDTPMTANPAAGIPTSTTFELPGYTVEPTYGLAWGLIVRRVG